MLVLELLIFVIGEPGAPCPHPSYAPLHGRCFVLCPSIPVSDDVCVASEVGDSDICGSLEDDEATAAAAKGTTSATITADTDTIAADAAPATEAPTTAAPTTAARAQRTDVDGGAKRFRDAAATRGVVGDDDGASNDAVPRPTPAPGPTGENIQRRKGRTSTDEEVITVVVDPDADASARETSQTSDGTAETNTDDADATVADFQSERRSPSDRHLDSIRYKHGCFALGEDEEILGKCVRPRRAPTVYVRSTISSRDGNTRGELRAKIKSIANVTLVRVAHLRACCAVVSNVIF